MSWIIIVNIQKFWRENWWDIVIANQKVLQKSDYHAWDPDFHIRMYSYKSVWPSMLILAVDLGSDS